MAVIDNTTKESFSVPKETPEKFKENENDKDVVEVEFVDFEGRRVKRTYKEKVNE